MIDFISADELLDKIKRIINSPNFEGYHLAFAEDVDPSSTARLIAYRQSPEELIDIIEARSLCVKTERSTVQHNLVVFIRNEQNIPVAFGAIEFFLTN